MEVACAKYAGAICTLDGKLTIAEAVRFFLHHRPEDVVPEHVPEFIDEFIATKTADGRSALSLKDLRLYLKRFREQFSGSILGITTVEGTNEFIRPHAQGSLRHRETGPD